MTAVENCIVWKTFKAFNLKQRERLVAAICMTSQETVEGNTHRSTVGCPQDFVDWGRRWGTDEMEAQVVLQNQWDNMLHHLMGITAAMKVWQFDAAASSSSHQEEPHSAGELVDTPCSDEGDDTCGAPLGKN